MMYRYKCSFDICGLTFWLAVDSCVPGDNVTVTGNVKVMSSDEGQSVESLTWHKVALANLTTIGGWQVFTPIGLT